MPTTKKYFYNLIGISFFIRLFIFVVFYTHVSIFPDSSGYIELAERLLDFNLSGYSGRRSPGYPLLIALAAGNLYLVVIYQLILGVFTSGYWYKSMIRLKFTPKISFFTALFLTTLLNTIFFETSILVESWALFLITVIAYRVIKDYQRKPSVKNEIITSLLLGLLTLVKPFYAFLPFLLYGLYVLKVFKLNRIFNKKIILLVFPLIAYFGWSYVNKLNTGYFVSTTFFGLNTAQNCVRFAEKTPAEYQWISEPYVEYREKAKKENKNLAMTIWYAYNDKAFEKYNLSFNELSVELGEFARTTIAQNPLDYLKQVVFYSWGDFWKPVIYWNYEDFNFSYTNKIFSMVWYVQRTLLIILRLSFLLLIPFYIFQMFKKRRVSIPFVLCMIVLATSVLQALVTYGGNARFSFPLEFIMVIVVMLFFKEYKYFGLIKEK